MNEYREQLTKETRRFSRQNMSLRMMDSHNTYHRESSAPATIYSTRMRATPREQRKVLFLGDAPRGEPEYQRPK